MAVVDLDNIQVLWINLIRLALFVFSLIWLTLLRLSIEGEKVDGSQYVLLPPSHDMKSFL